MTSSRANVEAWAVSQPPPDPRQPVDGQALRDRAQLVVLADQSGLASPVPLAG
jgi:hypothetical protein